MSEKLNKDNAANQIPQRFTLDSFKRISNQMVATSEAAWTNNNSRHSLYRKQKEYTMEEIQKIINSNDTVLQAKLSRDFFYKDGFYKRILMYYATLLKYTGVLIPNPAPGKSLSEKSLQKRYYSAMEYVDRMSLSTLLTNFSIRALINGAYYGVLVGKDKHDFVVLDLPQGYCRTLFKDFTGNDIIEFDVSYFNTISNKESRQEALKLYPKVISSYYRLWVKDKVTTPWVIIPSDIGICFPFYDGAPLFLNIIPATIQYDEAVETERERELEEIRKIIVQKIPHLNDGGLLFEPDEAEVIHQGTVGMMKGNKNVSVLTTYADVDSIISRTSSEAANNALEKMVQNIYAEGGVSGELFAATGSSSLETSIKNDIALMMSIANKYGRFITNVVNRLFGNGALSFKYLMLPISYYNESDYITDTFKLAQSGYSFLLPALACGFSQLEFSNLKDLENEVLNLGEKLIPLKSAYTASAGEESAGATEEGGRPSLKEKDKTEKTIENEKSIENQGGSN